MAKKKKAEGYLTAKEARAISRSNKKITNELERKRKRKNVPESEYLTTMHNPANAVEFDDLHTYFFTDAGTVKSVDGVTFDVPIGKTVGVVGESGCGKSVTSLSLMQLLQRPQGQIVSGEIRLNLGDKAYEISRVPQEAMQHIRGNVVSMIFQEPMTSLNPVFKIGAQLDEVIELHDGEGKSKEEVIAYMTSTGWYSEIEANNTFRYFSNRYKAIYYPCYYYGRWIMAKGYDQFPVERRQEYFKMIYTVPQTNSTLIKAIREATGNYDFDPFVGI